MLDRNASTPRVRHGPARAHEWRRTLIRYLIVWVGLLCLGAQFSTVFHALLVEHERCAEHGEWVHVAGARAESHVGARESSPDDRAFTAPGTSDEHCPTCSELRKVALLLPSMPELQAPTFDGEASASGRQSPVHSARVYSFAPKTSPPA
jgi:hypothetical protein